VRVATLRRLLATYDQQAEVLLEVRGGTRYHARDVKQPNMVASSDGKHRVIITSLDE
jgi:hypothetical protein